VRAVWRVCQYRRFVMSVGREPRTALRLRIREIAQTRVRYGYRKIRVLLIREGWQVGKKLVYRLYRDQLCANFRGSVHDRILERFRMES
jgi:hypothetical protein